MTKSTRLAEDMGFLMATSYKDGPAFKVKEFHEWKDEQRRKDAPTVHPKEWYYSEYGRYCERCRNDLAEKIIEQQEDGDDS